MASLPGFSLNITGASGSQGLLGPQQSWRAFVLPRGGYAAASSTGQNITFDSANTASRFTVNDWIQAGLATANIRQVGSVGGNSLNVTGANLTVAVNDRIYLFGQTQPTVTGGSATYNQPNTVIYTRDDDAGSTASNSMVTSDSNGLVQGWAAPAYYDLIIQDGNHTNQGQVIDLPIGVPGGISTTETSIFGATVTINWPLVLGNTLTVNAAFGVTGTAVLGQTTTVGGTLGVTSSAVIARLGPYSTAASGGAIRIVDGVQFPLTVAGVQTALNECETVGGGAVFVPANANIIIGTTWILVPNRTQLIAFGAAPSNPVTFTCNSGTSTTAVIRNKKADGTQQCCGLQGITIDGNSASGAIVTYGIYLSNIYNGTFVRDCRVINCSGEGLFNESTVPGIAIGPYPIHNVVMTANTGGHIRILGNASGISIRDCSLENPGIGKWSVKIDQQATTKLSHNHRIDNLYVECNDSTLNVIILDGANCCVISDVKVLGTVGQFASIVKVLNTSGDVGTCQHVMMGLLGSAGTWAIDDTAHGIQVPFSTSSVINYYVPPGISTAGSGPGQIYGIQRQGRGPSVATATTVNVSGVGNAEGNLFHLSGVTTVDSVIGTSRDDGRRITFKLDNNPTIRHNGGGGNIRLTGSANFSGTTNSSLSLIYDNVTATWIEDGRALL